MTSKPRLRLYVSADLAVDQSVTLPREQSHYVASVMRASVGEAVLVFNGRHGEWLAHIATLTKNAAILAISHQSRSQSAEPDLWLLAAPIKKDCIDLVAEKASELGASALWPVFTRRTVVNRVNSERLQAHLMEAAEQCERLTIPVLMEPTTLEKALAGWDHSRILLFLDESGGGTPIAHVLADLAGDRLAVLVGPEGGFTPEERTMLVQLPFTRPVSLGPRILRAETAAIASLAVIQALRGDWRKSEPRL